MKDKQYLNKSRELLSNGKIQDCIDLLKKNINDEDILNQVLQLEIRDSTLKRRITSGTIDVNDAQLEENRISNALLMLISNLAKGKKEIVYTNPPKKTFDFKWLIIGVLGLSLLGLGLYSLFDSDENTPQITASNPCENITCLNGGVCKDGTCDCPPGYTGNRCQNKPKPKDPCENITCLNRGVCRDGKCNCPSGYTGNRCQTIVGPDDPCKNINCLNGGVCRDGTCDCPSGYTGNRCQTRVNPNELVDTRDNTKYRTKKIGNKVWTLDNIKYNVSGSKCKSCNSKGRHYNLKMAKKACPKGWKLPSISDFKALNIVGGKNIQKIDQIVELKFNGRYGRASGGNDFVGVGTFASFWTEDSQGGNGSHFFYNKSANVFQADVQGNDQMYSCKCVKK